VDVQIDLSWIARELVRSVVPSDHLAPFRKLWLFRWRFHRQIFLIYPLMPFFFKALLL